MNSNTKMRSQSTRYELLAWALAIFYFLFFFNLSAFMYDHLVYKDQDLAIHMQTMWGIIRGSGFSSILGVHFLANHFSLISYPLSAFNFLLKTPYFLLCLQSLALASGVILSYKLSRSYLSGPWSLLIAATYFLYRNVGYANIFEFHATAIAVPFIFLMILGYVHRKWPLFAVTAIVALSCQENIALCLFVFGFLAVIEKRSLKWVLFPVILSAAWFYIGFYAVKKELGQGIMDWPLIYGHILREPAAAARALFSMPTALYLWETFFPYLFLPFFGFKFLLPAVPFLFQHALSLRKVETDFTFHYALEMVPFFIWGMTRGIVFIRARYTGKYFRGLFVGVLLAALAVTGIWRGPYFSALKVYEDLSGEHIVQFQKILLSRVPTDSATVATSQFLPALSQRSGLYSFHHVVMGTYTLSDKKYNLPDTVEYALLDMDPKNSFTFRFENENSRANMKEFFEKNPWEVVDFAQDTILLKKGNKGFAALYEVNPTEAPKPDIVLQAQINGQVELEGVSMKVEKGAHEGQIGIRFFWKSLKNLPKNYAMIFELVDSKDRMVHEYKRNICYRILPVSDWKENDVILENCWFVLPPTLPKEDLRLRFIMTDLDTGKPQPFENSPTGRVDGLGRLNVETLVCRAASKPDAS